MNLLLLLSALLSALCGAGVGARVPQAGQAITLSADAAVPLAESGVRRSFRPVAERPGLFGVAMPGPGTVLRLRAAVPLFMSRRRE